MYIVHKFRKARIVFQDNKIIEGFVVKCDIHMNTIIKQSIEYRLNKKSKKWEKRDIGLCVVRGCSISTISLI